jgi:glycosyltransferase involved in cell wall biosynthesis
VTATRVLFFLGSFEQGGTERQMAELVKNLPRDRYEPHVAVCNPADDLRYSMPFTDLHAPNGPDLRTFVPLARLVRRLDPHIIHSVHDPQNSYARVAARLARRRCATVGSLRCTRISKRTLRRERLTASLGSALIVNSRAIRDELERSGIGPVDVVENGVDGRRFAPLDEPARERVRARFGMGGTIFVVPARVAEQKNQLAVVSAVAYLRSRGEWQANGRVILAGRAQDGRYAERVDDAIRTLGLAGIVRRIPPAHDAEALLGAADATLLPSVYEGLPNVVLESLACGTPAIVSAAANADALVRDGETGLVTGIDGESIATAMRRFFDIPRDHRDAMGARGRGDMLARFEMSRMIDATCAIYDRVS